MEYRQLAENVYRVTKHHSQWNNQDRKRVETILRILQEEIEAELSKAGFVATPATSTKGVQVVSEKTAEVAPVSELRTIDEKRTVDNITEAIAEPMSLFQRIIIEQDNQVDSDESKNVVVKTAATTVAAIKPEGPEKRYYVTIKCSGVKSKPAFQIFKGIDVVAKDFQTDEILNTQKTFYAVIDSSRNEIAAEVDKHFTGAYISDFVEAAPDWVPPQYKTIWQNKTKLN